MASHSVDNIDDIVDRVVARHAGETKACRVLSPRFETAERDFDSCEFAREGEILKRRARWGDFQVAIARARENYEERHSASRHPGIPASRRSFDRQYLSRRLYELFAHLVRRRKNISMGLIIEARGVAARGDPCVPDEDGRRLFRGINRWSRLEGAIGAESFARRAYLFPFVHSVARQLAIVNARSSASQSFPLLLLLLDIPPHPRLLLLSLYF